MAILLKVLNHLGLTGSANVPKAALPVSNADREAASTLAWAFREVFKHQCSPTQGETPRSELGWYIAQALSNTAQTHPAAEFLRFPLGDRQSYGLERCPALLHQLNDPVLDTLWKIGTLRALSDLLAHLLLRAENPGHVLWNTADYVRQHHDLDLFAINKAYMDSKSKSEAQSSNL